MPLALSRPQAASLFLVPIAISSKTPLPLATHSQQSSVLDPVYFLEDPLSPPAPLFRVGTAYAAFLPFPSCLFPFLFFPRAAILLYPYPIRLRALRALPPPLCGQLLLFPKNKKRPDPSERLFPISIFYFLISIP